MPYNFKLPDDHILATKDFSTITSESALATTSYQYAVSPVDAALLDIHIDDAYPPLNENDTLAVIAEYGGRLHSSKERSAVEYTVDHKKLFTQEFCYDRRVADHYYEEVGDDVKLAHRDVYARNGMINSMSLHSQSETIIQNNIIVPVTPKSKLVVTVLFHDNFVCREQHARITKDDNTPYQEKIDTTEYLHKVWLRNNSILQAESAEYGQLTPLELTIWKLIRDVGQVKNMIETDPQAVRQQLLEAVGNANTVDRLIALHHHINKPPSP